MNDIDKELSWLEKQSKLHEDAPALKDAFEQIQTVRELMGIVVEQRKGMEHKESWEQAYFTLVDQHDADGENKQVQEAWTKYYMLKDLMQ